MLLTHLRRLKSWYLLQLRKKYFITLRNVFTPDTSIICNNCLGGRISQDLGYSYNSPTVGLYFFYPDYIRFLTNLFQYLQSPLHFRSESKYPQGRENMRKASHSYPIGYLEYNGEEVEIEFLHYHSESEAREKWERRVRRINKDKLIILGSDNDCCTKDDIQNFLQLPYKHKYFFSNHSYGFASNDFVYIEEMCNADRVNVWEKAHILYKHFNKLQTCI